MKIEQIFYLFIWSASTLYALFRFKNSCAHHFIISPTDFTKGWYILGYRIKDNSDIEWIILTTTFKKFNLFLFFQVFSTNILRIFFTRKREIIPIFYTVFSVICLSLIIGYAAVAVFIFYLLLMYIFHKLWKKSLCYIVTACALFLMHHSLFNFMQISLSMGHSESFLFDVGLAWLILKSLSFAVDRMNDVEKKLCRSSTFEDIFCLLAYSLYLPVVFTGPIISYENFYNQIFKTAQPLPLKELVSRFLHLLRQILFYFLYEFFLHYIYSHAVQFYPDAVKNYDSFALCGLGYALPMMFFLKYYIIYGVSKCIAKLEDIELPPPPKCISCIHLSSHFAKHFDRGLYLWILKYLYMPIVNNKWTLLRKIQALCICFSFVCIWHGMDTSIVISTSLNCVLVASEIAVQFFLTTKIGRLFEEIPHGPRTRISAAFATPHFLMMCISCCFFLSNFDIGMLIIERVILGGITPLLPLILIMYCGCHVSMKWKEHQQNDKSVNMSNKSN
ncbi:hypothetical protein NPIL_642641 [Nephila pilipes]|uniref:Protein-cysteine N-palmitoyltransferase Rasp n=1 Tax=Nephila pilipes TaxID=299642 RepID=A0A8X6P820_NEPPI|nr:hypothetical protein NPIL_131851 [Nephila pilipes]GFT80773.1 hypothetical protein NPIL_642641 [Nephila pilipes]